MYCPKCGTQNNDSAYSCYHCGTQLRPGENYYQPPPPQPYYPPQSVPSYLVWAILVTVLCCIWLGIPAIVYAAQVNSKLASGDYAGAMESSRKAAMWCWIAFAVGLIGQIIYFGFYFAYILAMIGLSSSGY